MEVSKDNNSNFICGNSLDLLREIPSNSVDAVITDPPYCSGGNSAASRQIDPAKKYVQGGTKVMRPSFGGDLRDQRSWGYWCSLWIGECLRTMKDGGYFLMFTDWRQLPQATDALQAGGVVWRGIVAWDKTRSARPPHTGYFRHQCEYIVWGSKGALPKNDRGPFDGCFSFPVLQKDKHHMTGKPTALMRELVKVAPPDGVILDPFAGSGTTCVAAALEGRRFIGIEMEPAYAEIAKQRLDEMEVA
ncbi:MAG: site-specific DNA-methyltransferase [Synergistales bacterium]|nr:site-specific DNA-methyltransferase [Synergistales bacterium]